MWLFTRNDDDGIDPWAGRPHAWGTAPSPVKHPKVTGPTADDDRSWFDRIRGVAATANGVWRGDDLPATQPAPSFLTDWWHGR